VIVASSLAGLFHPHVGELVTQLHASQTTNDFSKSNKTQDGIHFRISGDDAVFYCSVVVTRESNLS